ITFQLNNLTLDRAVGEYLANIYREALTYPKEQRLQIITTSTELLKSSQSDTACLGRIPTKEEMEKKQLFTPTKAREELFDTLLARSAAFISDWHVHGKNAIYVSFKDIILNNEPDQERQRLVLKALIHLMIVENRKPGSLTITYCAVLDSN